MKYVIQKESDKVYSYLLDESGHAVEIHADALSGGPKIGDIYIGLVQKVAKNLNAAFVEIVPGINGYLPFDEIISPVYTAKGPGKDIQAGDQLVVQITRDAFGNKDRSLSTRITLHGKHVVLISGGAGLGVSKKIPPEKRQLLKERILSSGEFGSLQKRIGPCSLVVRTSAGALLSKEEEEILDDIELLAAEMTDLKLKAPYRSVHSALRKQPPRWMNRILRQDAGQTESVVTDDEVLYRQMIQAAEAAGRGDLVIRLYMDSMVSMAKVYSLERELERALNKKVNLKSGSDLIIESTEALHIIDVNSGRAQSSKKKEEALLMVNLEAAREAARQIRLRNLSGIIVIDFINLTKQKNSLRVLEELRCAVSRDPVKTQVVDMTKLGLVEITRQKIEVPLKDQISERTEQMRNKQGNRIGSIAGDT